jgi:hypothetical protein
MTHTANGPTVSREEAERLEHETAEHLLKNRKLSLIVDLDQTIVHATVDPTVGEWIAEGEAWEAREKRRVHKRARKTRKGVGEDVGSPSDSDSTSEESDEDESNPNWEALKDVKRFRLAHDTGVPQSRGKGKEIEQGCLYYVKPRCVLHMVALVLLMLMPCVGRAYKNSSPASRPCMKCTFILWVPELTPRKYAPPSTPTINSSVDACSVATRAAVRFLVYLP